MANLQSQIDILGKAIVREHIKREDEKTELIAVNDNKMLQRQYGAGTNDVDDGSGTGNIKTVTTLTLKSDNVEKSESSVVLANRNNKTNNETNITINNSAVKFHIEDNSHLVNGFMVIDDETLSIETKDGETTAKYIKVDDQTTTETKTKNNIYIIDSMGNIIPNTTIAASDTDATEVGTMTFDEKIEKGTYRLADLNKVYTENDQHQMNFINIGEQTTTPESP